MFSTLSKIEIVPLAMFNLLSVYALNLVTSKILLFGKELKRCMYNKKNIPKYVPVRILRILNKKPFVCRKNVSGQKGREFYRVNCFDIQIFLVVLKQA